MKFKFRIYFINLIFCFSNNIMHLYSSDMMIVECGAEHLRKIALMYVACGLSVMIFGASRGSKRTRSTD